MLRQRASLKSGSMIPRDNIETTSKRAAIGPHASGDRCPWPRYRGMAAERFNSRLSPSGRVPPVSFECFARFRATLRFPLHAPSRGRLNRRCETAHRISGNRTQAENVRGKARNLAEPGLSHLRFRRHDRRELHIFLAASMDLRPRFSLKRARILFEGCFQAHGTNG